MMSKKTLSAKAQRQGFARASAAKRFLLTLIAPELLELRAQHDALEMLVVDHIASTRPKIDLDDSSRHDHGEDLQEELLHLRKKALADLPEDDKLRHLADPTVSKAIWKDIEERMVRDIENKQRKPLLNATGIEDE